MRAAWRTDGHHGWNCFVVGAMDMMEVELIFKLAGLGVVVTVLSQVLTRAGREEVGTLVTVVGLVIALLLVANLISDLFTSLQSLFSLN